MTDRPRDPLALTTRLVVDGSNLLYALRRGPEPQPAATLIGRLRAVVPADIPIDLLFDGPPETGLRGERIAAGLRVRYSGSRTADSVILSLVDEVRLAEGPESTAGLLVVTDDADLRSRLRGRGARSAGADWLVGRLARGRLASPAAGNRRPPVGGTLRGPAADADEAPGWMPGRGATTKRGPARKQPRRRGADRAGG